MEGKQEQIKGEVELCEAQADLFKHIFSFVRSMCLKSAIQIGIPDTIFNHGRPITLPQLVSALKINPSRSSHVHRLMRLLVHSGIFTSTKVPKEDDNDEEEEQGYELTPCSRLLLKDKIPSMFAYAQAVFHPAVMSPGQFLGDWLYKEEDNTAFQSAFGMEFWRYGSKNPEFSRVFNEGMISDSGTMMNFVMKKFKSVFWGLKSLVDVGGGKGGAAMAICEELPDLKCTVMDLPHVVAEMKDSDNLKFVGGDMFQCIPSADAIFLKLVLHTLSDEECGKVLKKCREAISSKGKVIIIDIVINEEKDKQEITEAQLYFDVMMMCLVNGEERDEQQWKKLFLEAGFSHYKISALFGLRSLIEVYP
ncbi:trans-resveratrol di-O-methyltransferase-like [Neltuma alba]|uniref:trans-resveratrol di-O-methyltransferase-like n=1 Tax=Neltuma alba TaxID=207710 RepID=UPI0010A55F1D|nr:trans-resveratrol di-O-methyltransferase-like [Prosopis alba]